MAAKKQKTEDTTTLLRLVADIRAAVGDPHGRLMQDELVARCLCLREVSDWVDEAQRVKATATKDGWICEQGPEWNATLILDSE